jgi:predicted small secreted protein
MESLPMRTRLLVFAVLGVAVALAGCHRGTRPDGTHVDKGGVTDMQPFENFIATHPTPDEFKKMYPGVLLMMPGMVSTMEIRYDNTRFFPQLDSSGHIIGGDFH